MLETLFNGGPFMIVLAIILSVIPFLSIKNINEPYKTNNIVLLGVSGGIIMLFSAPVWYYFVKKHNISNT